MLINQLKLVRKSIKTAVSFTFLYEVKIPQIHGLALKTHVTYIFGRLDYDILMTWCNTQKQ